MLLLDEFEAVLLGEEAPVALLEGFEVALRVSVVLGDRVVFMVDVSDNGCVIGEADIAWVPLTARLVSIGLHSNFLTLH